MEYKIGRVLGDGFGKALRARSRIALRDWFRSLYSIHDHLEIIEGS